MAIRRSRSRTELQRIKRRSALRRRAETQRRMRLESLEGRRLLAVGPQLVSIQPNEGSFLEDGDTRNVAFEDFSFRFDEANPIDPTTVEDGIRLVASGLDGDFTDGDEFVIQPGYIGIGQVPNEVVMRFSEPLPDETYRLEVIGSGDDPLRDMDGDAFNDGVDTIVEFNLELGAQIIAVVPQPIERVNGDLVQHSDQIVIYFNDDDLFVENDSNGDPTSRSAENPAFYQLILTQDSASNTDDVSFLPQEVNYNPDSDTAVLTFAQPIDQLASGNGTFRLRVGTTEAAPTPPVVVDLTVEADSDLGTSGSADFNFSTDVRIAEVFGNPVTVHFESADLGGAGTDVSVSEHLITATIDSSIQTTAQDLAAAISSNSYVSVVVTGDLNALITSTPEAIRLVGQGSTFDTATELGPIDPDGQIISSSIDPQIQKLDFIGTEDEPGHRHLDDEVGLGFEKHINPIFGQDATPGISTLRYNFRADYGQTPAGEPLVNLITEPQKQRVREALQIWGEKLGVQFLETESGGMTFVTGDPLALDPLDPRVANHAIFDPDADEDIIIRVDPDFADSMMILDNSRQWVNDFGADYFERVMTGVGFMLGLGRASDLPDGNLMSFASDFQYPGQSESEPIFPGNADVIHGRVRFRSDSNDIDLYKFTVDNGDDTGLLTIETFAERQPNSSLLDSLLSLYREFDVFDSQGNFVGVERELIARNDDYYSEDSHIEVELGSGTYYVAVTASGNDLFDPDSDNTGFDGTSQGDYDLRIHYRPTPAGDEIIRDRDGTGEGTALDGDHSGQPGGVYNFWFRSVDPAKQIIVDKSHTPTAGQVGTLSNPYENIQNAVAAAQAGDIIRIVGNGGLDEDIDTVEDNLAYEIGRGTLPGQILADGTELAVPKDVTVMIDAGAIFKLRQARIGVGSSSLGVDRSGSALQVLGIPTQPVLFTSWLNEDIGLDTFFPETTPGNGDWGGILFQADQDNAEGRFNYENEGIFLNYVNNANFTFGGGQVIIDSQLQVVNPIQMIESRPTVSYNHISFSADAALSADPNSFEETNFHAPRFQLNESYTSDYQRIGPDIDKNILVDNSTNGLFVKILTPAGDELRKLTVPGRFDDTDVVHVISENLQIEGTPGEAILLVSRPAVGLVALAQRPGGSLPDDSYNYKVVFVDRNGFEGRPSDATLSINATQGSILLDNLPPVEGEDFFRKRIYRSSPGGVGPYHRIAELNPSELQFLDDGTVSGPVLERDPPTLNAISLTLGTNGTLTAGTYNYRMTMVDADGNEGPASDPSATVAISGAIDSIDLSNLPVATGSAVSRRLYRSAASGVGPYTLIAELNDTDTTFTDSGANLDDELDVTLLGVIRARTDARLRIDPGTVIKLEGARIETIFGAQLIAEGTDGSNIIFTSKNDDRFGRGGTFDTNNDGTDPDDGSAVPAPGDWGGLYLGQTASASIDHALLTFGGGLTRIEGTFSQFNIIEVHQAGLRLANSVIEQNAAGVGGPGPVDRFGRLATEEATIFVRGAQPIVLKNIIRDNEGKAITINANSFGPDPIDDSGRTTGLLNLEGSFGSNRGPLLNGNILENNPINGLEIRGEVLTSQAVWDDIDIVHTLFDQVIVPNFHTLGGLRLQSAPNGSLVVKLFGEGDSFDSGNGAGITSMGRPLDIEDRIGGIVQVIGQPDFPVILTSFRDDTVGAGFTVSGEVQTDTNNDTTNSVPRAGDWRSVRIDQFSHDRNVEIFIESEAPDETAPGANANPDAAQFLGELAPFELGGDETLRLGFEVQGLLNENNDADIYSFNATAGTEVWLDIDRTLPTLDSVVELLDAEGRVLARSVNSINETLDPNLLFESDLVPDDTVSPLNRTPDPYQPRHASGLIKDYYSLNIHDAGMRVILPGVVGTRSTYHVRVRSNSPDIENLDAGLTNGAYQLQIRLGETDEFPGVTVRHAHISYAMNGVEVMSLPGHSPLLGENAEDEANGGSSNNSFHVHNYIHPDDPPLEVPPPARIWPAFFGNNPENGPQDLGNILASDLGVMSLAGELSDLNDTDFFEFQVDYNSAGQSPEHVSVVFDIDYADGLTRPDTILTIFDAFARPVLIGHNSNISDDRSDDLTDFSKGSVGILDPFIGNVELPEGTYFAAITSAARIPNELLTNPLLRLEPVNSIQRIAEDHILDRGGSTAADPTTPYLVEAPNLQISPAEDLSLFVIRGVPDTDDQTDLFVLNPANGATLRSVETYDQNVEDLATRSDGTVFTFSAPEEDDEIPAALFQGVSLNETQYVAAQASGILLFEDDGAGRSIPSVDDDGVDAGIIFNGMAFGKINGVEHLFAVGNRSDIDDDPMPTGPDYFDNILYLLDPVTGEAFTETERVDTGLLAGAGSQILERGFLDTNTAGGPGGRVTGLTMMDGELYALSDTSGLFRVIDPLTTNAHLEYIGDLIPNAGTVDEVDGNDDLETAHDLDLEVWTKRFSTDIGDELENTSTTIRHITIEAHGDDGYIDAFPGLDEGGLTLPEGIAFGPDINGDGVADMYVASSDTHEILRYDGATGEFLDTFVTSGFGGLDEPQLPLFMDDINFDGIKELLVTSFETDNVLRYDGASGAFLGVFASGINEPTGMAFGPDGNLYVASSAGNSVLRFHGTTGAPLGNFFPNNNNFGLSDPQGILFRTNDFGRVELLVASQGNDAVYRYNGLTGNFIDQFVPTGSGGLDAPELGMALGPDGHLYVSSSGTDQVLRYHGQSGAYIGDHGDRGGFPGQYMRSGEGGLESPSGLAFDDDGNLYVASCRSLDDGCSDIPDDVSIAPGNKILKFGVGDGVEDWVWNRDFSENEGFGPGDQLGTGLDFQGDTMVASAPGENSVYVYGRNTLGNTDPTDDIWTRQAVVTSSDIRAGDAFGAEVALDGDLLLVGAPDTDAVSTVTAPGPTMDTFVGEAALSDQDDIYNRLRVTFTNTANPFLQNRTFTVADYDGATKTFTFTFNMPVAPSPGDEYRIDTNSGATYVFRNIAGTWTQEARLQHRDFRPQEDFGLELDLRGDTAAIGLAQSLSDEGTVNPIVQQANRFTGNNELSRADDAYTGQILLFIEGPLQGQHRVIEDYLGGSRTFVFDDNPFPRAPSSGDDFLILTSLEGAAYIYRDSGGTWSQQARLESHGAGLFGHSVELHQDGVLIGSPTRSVETGTAFDFEVDTQNTANPLDDTWSQVQAITASDASPFDDFGWEMSIDGASLLVSAPGDDFDTGAAYVFDKVGGVWTESAKILATDGIEDDRFGESVSIDGERLAVGTIEGHEGVDSSGSVYIYHQQPDASWTEFSEVTASGVATANDFGQHVVLQGSTLLVSDPLHDRFGTNSGTVQEFIFQEINDGVFLDTFTPIDTAGLDDPRDMAIGPDGKLYIASARSDSILRFIPETGVFDTTLKFDGIFVAGGAGGLDEPHGVLFGPDRSGDNQQDLYVTSRASNQVMVFNGQTGEFVEIFANIGLDEPAGLTWGPDANNDGNADLYVSNFNSDSVFRYDGTNGRFISVFVPFASNGLDGPVGLEFRPDGLLYIASSNSNEILRFRGSDAQFVDSFIDDTDGLADPQHFAFADDGNLYITSLSGDVIQRYDATTRAFVDTFSSLANEGMDAPVGIIIGPDINGDGVGEFFVSSSHTDQIYRMDHRGTPTFDYFKFTIADDEDGGRAIIDIDYGDDGNDGSINTQIWLMNQGGGIIAANDDFRPQAGEEGSINRTDAYLEVEDLGPGEYYVVVAEYRTPDEPADTDTFNGTGNRPDLTDSYTLNISVEGREGLTFQGLTSTVRATPGLADTFMAIDSVGQLYAFGNDAAPMPVFTGGLAQVPSNIENPQGLALSSRVLEIETDRHADLGHGRPDVFDNSRGRNTTGVEHEPNDIPADAHDLELEHWSRGYDSTIQDALGNNISRIFPHVSVNGTGDGTHDYYSFRVDQPTVGFVDIDINLDHLHHPNGVMDAELTVMDLNGNIIASYLGGCAYCEDNFPVGGPDLLTFDFGSWVRTDPFGAVTSNPPAPTTQIPLAFDTPGTYVIQVTKRDRTRIPSLGWAPEEGDAYTLHLSLRDHASSEAHDGGAAIKFTYDIQGVVENAVKSGLDEYTITSQFHGLLGGERLYLEDIEGATTANGTWEVTGIDDEHNFTIEVIDNTLDGDYRGGGTWRLLEIGPEAKGSVISEPFSLKGYSAADIPVIYFSYYMELLDEATDVFNFSVIDGNGNETILASKNDGMVNTPITSIDPNVWRQARISLADFAGQEDLRLKFELVSVDESQSEGVFIDDIIIGFAERGEMISHSLPNPGFLFDTSVDPNTRVLDGEYQLEIRQSNSFGRSTFATPQTSHIPTLLLQETIDTNDRLTTQTTIEVESGASYFDGQLFVIRDGNDAVTFEIDRGDGVAEGHQPVIIPFTATDYEAAFAIRDAINDLSVQTILDVTAESSDGTRTGFDSTDNRVHLFGNAVLEGTLLVTNHQGHGDENLPRAQGNVSIHSNLITDSRDYGIVADQSPRQAEEGVPYGFMGTGVAATRNLGQINSLPEGGLAPGIILENNIISGEGLGGIHISGDIQPYEMTIIRGTGFPNQFQGNGTAGDRVCDGQTFQVRAYSTTLTFEWEDIGGSGRPCGSGVLGGNGWTPGNVPVFYRRTGQTMLNRNLGYTQEEMAVAIRDAINGSILVTNGTSQTVEAVVTKSRLVGDSVVGPDPAVYLRNASFVTPTNQFPGFITRRLGLNESPQSFARITNNTIYGADGTQSFYPGTGFDEPNETMETATQTYQGRAKSPHIYSTTGIIGDTEADLSDPSLDVDFYQVQLDIGDRLVVDVDANEASFATANFEFAPPNHLNTSIKITSNQVGDFFSDIPVIFERVVSIGDVATATFADKELRVDVDPLFTTAQTIVDAINAEGTFFAELDLSVDTTNDGTGIPDFQGTIATTALGSLGTGLDPVVRVFNATGHQVAYSDDDAAPGELQSFDSYIDFTTFTPGTYYIAVSGGGNETYNPQSLGGRTGPASRGVYQIEIDVLAERKWILDFTQLDGVTPGLEGSFVTVSDRTNTFSFVYNDILTPFPPLTDAPVEGVSSGIVDDLVPTNTSFVTDLDETRDDYYNGLNIVFTSGPLTGVDRIITGYDAATKRITFDPPTPIPPLADDEFTIVGVIHYDSTPIPNGGNRQSGFRAPELTYETYTTIDRAESLDIDVIPLGGRHGITAGGGPTSTDPFPVVPDFVWSRQVSGIFFSFDNVFTPNNFAKTEQYLVIDRASLVQSTFVPQTPNENSNHDELLPETGILVSENASPTLLNNVLTNLQNGIIQEESDTTVVGAALYQHIAQTETNVNPIEGDFSISLGNFEPLFFNSPDNNFYPATGSRTIDSAIDSLEDRSDYANMREALGIPKSPILAPNFDSSGQLRVDDPEVAPPLGQGANVFKDRGAVDRADFAGPTALLIDPRDNDVEGADIDPTESVVQLKAGEILRSISIQVVDGSDDNAQAVGIGVNDGSVSTEKVSITSDGVLLTEGIDYSFRYDHTSNIIRLNHISGIWPDDKVYVVRLNNKDRFVVEIPPAGEVNDGDIFFVLDETGNTVHFEFESGYSLMIPETLTLHVPSDGVQDSERFEVLPPFGTPVTFEFDSNTPPSFLPGNVPVDISNANTPDEIAQAIVDAINGTNVGLSPKVLGNGQVHVGAPTGYIVRLDNTTITSTGISGVVTDLDRILISDSSRSVTLEFDDTDLNNGTLPVSTVIPFDHSMTTDELGAAVLDALQSTTFNITPQYFGDGRLHIGGDLDLTVDTQFAREITSLGQPGVTDQSTIALPGPVTIIVPPEAGGVDGISDGQTFTINDGVTQVRFEFEDRTIGDGVGPFNTGITFTPDTTVDQLVTVIMSALDNAGLGLNPTDLGNGEIQLGATLVHEVDTSSSALTQKGQEGGVRDGESFRILLGDETATFEFDNNGNTTPGNEVILFSSDISEDDLIDAIAAKIRLTDIQLDPTNLGNGVLALNDTTRHIVDVGRSSLELNGVPGGAVAIPFIPDNSTPSEIFETSIIDTILQSSLSGVRISLRGGNTYFLDGAESVSGTIPSEFVGAIKDLSGNNLIANQETDETQFTIVTPNVSVDFGDAPFDALFEDNGARHAIDSKGLFLGNEVDADREGQPTGAADGDDNDGNNDDDGVTFDTILNAFIQTPITVNASGRGFVDAWIDYNRDGDFDDPNEQIINSVIVNQGNNEFIVQAPSDSDPGLTYARFRISSTGKLQPTGISPDGEVEDYAIDIVPGVPPTADNDAFGIANEDIIFNVPAPGVLDGDTDPDLDQLSVETYDDTTTNGATIQMATDGSFTYDGTGSVAIQSLAQGASLDDTFTYRATDGVLPSNLATVTVTVAGANDAPIANPFSVTAREDGAAVIRPLPGDDIDSDNDQTDLTYILVSGVSEGSVSLNGDRFTFDPEDDFQDLGVNDSRDVTFQYKVEDRHGAESGNATVTITVLGTNDAPTSDDVTLGGVVEDGPTVDGSFTGNDIDSDNDASDLSFDVISTPSEGLVTNNDDGTFTFDPSTDFQTLAQGATRDVTFDYRSRDRHGEVSAASTVTVTVTGVNDNPTGVNDSFTVDQDELLDVVAAGLLGNDSDIDIGDEIGVVGFNGTGQMSGTTAKGASVTLSDDGAFTYDPRTSSQLASLGRDDSDVDTFTYQIQDGLGGTSEATVSITVNGVNDPPTLGDDNYNAIEDDLLNVVSAAGVLNNDSDPEGDAISIVGINGTNNFTGTSANGADVSMNSSGGFSYDPRNATNLQALNNGEELVDTFTYSVTDNNGGTSTATVNITVSGVNDAPVASNDSVIGPRNTTLDIDILGNDNDVDDDTLSVLITTQPTVGSLTVNNDNTVSYNPPQNFSGTTSFTYRLQDPQGGLSGVATVSIDINDAPVAVDDDVQTFIDEEIVIEVLENDSDPDGQLDITSVSIVDIALNGTLEVANDGTVTYTPDPGFEGTDTFTYTVADTRGLISNVATVDIAVDVNPFPFQNFRNNLDVNDDGDISPIDALLVINFLNDNGTTVVPPDGITPPPYLDPSGDNIISPNDALLVINFLNDVAVGEDEPEGEGEAQQVDLLFVQQANDEQEQTSPLSEESDLEAGFGEVDNAVHTANNFANYQSSQSFDLELALDDIIDSVVDARDETTADIALTEFVFNKKK